MNKLIFTFGLLFFFIFSCTIKEANIHTYIYPGYIPGQINSIAFLSVHESAAKEIEARRMNTRVFHAFLDKNPHIEVLSQSKSTSLMDNNHLSDTWTAFLKNYELYGRPDIELLSTIGSTLNIDGIMQGEIIELTQIEGKVGLNRATTEIKIRYRLFDTYRGRLVWEAVSDGIKIAATDTEPLPPVWDVLKLATDKLSYYLPSL
jgi:hypothetical protein